MEGSGIVDEMEKIWIRVHVIDDMIESLVKEREELGMKWRGNCRNEIEKLEGMIESDEEEKYNRRIEKEMFELNKGDDE